MTHSRKDKYKNRYYIQEESNRYKKQQQNIKMLKNELWTRRVSIEAKVIVLRENQVVEETILLDKIRKNQTREQKVQKELEKYDRIIYIEERIYIPNN